jgi:hypothetical protein
MNEKATQENYTDAMVKRLHEVYQPDATEEERDKQLQKLSDELNRKVASVRAKLVREGLYVKKEYRKKTGDKPETKETIVGAIAEIMGVDADASLSGLEKATKNCLILLRGTIKAAVEVTAEAEAAEAAEAEAETS